MQETRDKTCKRNSGPKRMDRFPTVGTTEIRLLRICKEEQVQVFAIRVERYSSFAI